VVAWLVSEECPVTGEVYSVGGGRVARVFLGVTPGYFNRELTLEDVRDNFDQIRSEEGYVIPNNANEELALIIPHLAG
jgi:hypothetical protein